MELMENEWKIMDISQKNKNNPVISKNRVIVVRTSTCFYKKTS